MSVFSQLYRLASTANHRKSAQRDKLRFALEQLEDRVQPSVTGFRPIDETGNNAAKPTLGTAGTDLLRVSPVAYADGVSLPRAAQ